MGAPVGGGGGAWPAARAARIFFFLPASCLGAFFSSTSADFFGLSLLAFLSPAAVTSASSSASLLEDNRDGPFEGSRIECMRIMFIRRACFRILIRSSRLCCTIIKFIFGEDMVLDRLGLAFAGTRRDGGATGLITGEALIVAAELSLLSSTGKSLRVCDGLRLRAAFIVASFPEFRIASEALFDPGVGSGFGGDFITEEDAEATTNSVDEREGVTCFMEAGQYLRVVASSARSWTLQIMLTSSGRRLLFA